MSSDHPGLHAHVFTRGAQGPATIFPFGANVTAAEARSVVMQDYPWATVLYDGDRVIVSTGASSSVALDPIVDPLVEGTTMANGYGIPFGPDQFGAGGVGTLDSTFGTGGALIIGPGALAAMRLLGPWLAARGQSTVFAIKNNPLKALLGVESVDFLTPGIDLPSPSDLPGAIASIPSSAWNAIKAIFAVPSNIIDEFVGGGGSAVAVFDQTTPLGWAQAQHGPVVKEWVANGVPFVEFMDGWLAARKNTGAWTFWKPKKPVVYVPGGNNSRSQMRKLARIYKMARDHAKKDFGLVDKRTNGRTPTVKVSESGPGSVRITT